MTHSTLTTTLQELRRRLSAIETGAGAVWTSIAVIASLLAWMWLDVVLELPSGLRVVAWLFAALSAGTVVVSIRRSAGRRCEVRSLARRLDATAGASGQIMTGVELMTALKVRTSGSGGLQPAGPLTVGLAEMAVDCAATLASTVSVVQAAPSRPLHRPAWVFSLLIVGIGVVSILSPRLAKTQWLRFVDPYGDHPAYSHVWFDVQPGMTRVIYGEGLDITVRPRGGTPERVDLVLQTSGLAEVETLPMFPESGGSWRATVASLTRPHRYYVRAARARSHQYDIGIQTVPRLEAVRFKIKPPAYSRKPGYDGQLPPGGLVGLPRTQMQVWAKSNRPLSGGQIDFKASAAVSATAPAAVPSTTNLARTTDPNEVTGTVTLHASGQFVIRITDVDGQPSPRTFTAPVTLAPDERPFIRLLAPPAESLATPTAVIPVTLAAEDDCGISRVQLFRSLNDSRPLPMDVPLPSVAPARWSETVELRLASYGLQPGDEIKLFGRVEDNDPDGVKGSESNIATIRIIAQADYERLVGIQAGMETMLAKYQQTDRRMESLLAEVFLLIEDQARFVALYERQRELTARLAAMKDREQGTDPATRVRMRDLEVEQEHLHDALDALLSEIDEHVATLPDDRRLDDLRETAKEFVGDVRGSRILPAMAEAQSALADFSGTRAYRAATEATEAMARFLGRCQSLGQSGQMCLKFQPALSGSMGNTIKQMLSEAGLASKGLQGAGAGSGYSAARSSLRNVGMYGGLSDMANTARGGSLHGRRVETTQAGQESSGQYSALPGGTPGADPATVGAGSPEVPAQYRRKVGQYFERIAEEMPDRRPAPRPR